MDSCPITPMCAFKRPVLDFVSPLCWCSMGSRPGRCAAHSSSSTPTLISHVFMEYTGAPSWQKRRGALSSSEEKQLCAYKFVASVLGRNTTRVWWSDVHKLWPYSVASWQTESHSNVKGIHIFSTVKKNSTAIWLAGKQHVLLMKYE